MHMCEHVRGGLCAVKSVPCTMSQSCRKERSDWLSVGIKVWNVTLLWKGFKMCLMHRESKLDYFIKEKLRFLFGEAVFPISFCKGRSWSKVLQTFFWPSFEVVSCCCKCSFSVRAGAALTPRKDANDGATWIPIYPEISVIMNYCITRIEATHQFIVQLQQCHLVRVQYFFLWRSLYNIL